MAPNMESPFAGRPETAEFTDASGRPGYAIKVRALSPLAAKVADGTGGVAALAAGAEGLAYLASLPDPAPWTWGAAVLGPWLAYPVLKRAFRYFLMAPSRIVMTVDLFQVKGWRGWKRYDRQLPHKFRLIPHDKAAIEKEKREIAARKAAARGKMTDKHRYYSEAYHLSFEYLGQRRDVLTIFGRKQALEVLARLKACDEVLNAHVNKGDGIALKPEQEWGDQPGAIPEDAS